MRIRSTDVLIAALGALLAHEVAYGVVDLATGPDHGHIPALAAIVIPVGFVVIARLALRPFAAHLASTPHRAALQLALFLALEFVEHPGGLAELASNPAVLLGLALQPVVAWPIGASVRHAREIVRRTIGGERRAEPAAALVPEAPSAPVLTVGASLLPFRRGPPRSVTH